MHSFLQWFTALSSFPKLTELRDTCSTYSKYLQNCAVQIILWEMLFKAMDFQICTYVQTIAVGRTEFVLTSHWHMLSLFPYFLIFLCEFPLFQKFGHLNFNKTSCIKVCSISWWLWNSYFKWKYKAIILKWKKPFSLCPQSTWQKK